MGELGRDGKCLGAFRDKMEYSNLVSRGKTILLHVDQAHILILLQAALLKFKISLLYTCIDFVNLLCTQFAQLKTRNGKAYPHTISW